MKVILKKGASYHGSFTDNPSIGVTGISSRDIEFDYDDTEIVYGSGSVYIKRKYTYKKPYPRWSDIQICSIEWESTDDNEALKL